MKEKEKNFATAIVYVNDYEERIEAFLKTIHTTLEDNFLNYEIICVDDFSTDNSIQLIHNYANSVNKSVFTIIHMSYYQGKELSVNAGVDLSIGDFIFEFDTVALDYKADLVMDVYNTALEGFDIVSAVAIKKQKITSKIFYTLFNRYSESQYRLETEAFRILSRRAINRIHAASKTIPYRKALYASCGLKHSSIEYTPVSNQREPGNSKARKAKKELAMDSLVLFTDIAYRFTMLMAGLMILATVIVATYTLIVFFTGTPVAGWTTTMLFLSVCFFGIFAVLTIVLKYLSLLIDLVFRKSKYTYESIEKITK
jgi:dolichol-phosphate mannosyltransferase